jgi:predicted transcriptional regulator
MWNFPHFDSRITNDSKEFSLMFERCIACERLGQDCAPSLLSLPWPELLAWWKKRQAHLGWSNQVLSDKSTIPLGTINRIKAGEDDCRYSTMRCIIHALMGSYSVEFPCQKKLDQEFAQLETLEKQCERLTAENEQLLSQMKTMEEKHKAAEAILKDLERALADKAEAQKKTDFLLDLVAKLRADNDNLWAENKRKSIIVDKYLESIKQ